MRGQSTLAPRWLHNMAEEPLTLPPPQPLYFAVGPNAREITCPYCKTLAKTRLVRAWLRCCTKRHHCGACGEYLGVYRRPQL